MSTATLRRKTRSDKGGTHAVEGRPRADNKEIVRRVHTILKQVQDGIPLPELLEENGLDSRGWERWYEIYWASTQTEETTRIVRATRTILEKLQGGTPLPTLLAVHKISKKDWVRWQQIHALAKFN